MDDHPTVTAPMFLDNAAFSSSDEDDAEAAFRRAARDELAQSEHDAFFTVESDESDDEPPVLLYDAEEAASAHSQVAVFDGPTMEQMSESIASDLARLNIGPPQLGSVPMSIVVQFWQEGAADAPIEFLFEVEEMVIQREIMDRFCTRFYTAPYRARHLVVESADSGSDDDDDDPTCWIPESGRVNVLGVIYAEAPVIVGFLTEHYDVRENAATEPDTFDTDRLNSDGKRVLWMDGAAGGKRTRTGDDDDVTTSGVTLVEEEDAASSMLTNMYDFADNGNQEWTSAINRDALICAFERDAVTGHIKEVRAAIALHALALRRSLQAALTDTRNNI